MSLKRREFLRTGLLATGAAAAGVGGKELVGGTAESGPPTGGEVAALTEDGRLVAVPAAAATVGSGRAADRAGIPGRRWVMVIDLAVCDGCDDCIEECRKNHSSLPGQEFIRIYKMQDSPETAPYWFPKPCFHCDEPPCAKVCPVGATYKRTDGLVLVDAERCIGCRFCMAACPYSTRVFNWSHPAAPAGGTADGHVRRIGTVEKCDFCADTLPDGDLPHCVTTCTMGATYFGDANEDAVTNGKGETVRLSELLHDQAAYRYLEDLGTEPRVYYLPPSGRRYPAPSRAQSHGVPSHAEVTS